MLVHTELQRPPKAVARDEIELVLQLSKGDSINSISPQHPANYGTSTDVQMVPNPPEAATSPSPGSTLETGPLNEAPKMTSSNPPRNRLRIVVVCAWTFCLGYTDSAPGALLPFIEAYYGISYSIVSLIWIAAAAGFLVVAATSHRIQGYFGPQYSYLVGCLFLVVMFAVVLAGVPFPVVVVSFFVGGIGTSICIGQSNVFLANMDKQAKYLLVSHACYGLGGTISPLLATVLAANAKVKWHYVYLINLGLMVICLGLVWYAFRGSNIDLKPWEEPENTDSENAMHHAVRNRLTWILALFLLFYQGLEVAIAGWCVTYLIHYKQGNIKSTGYVALGFWAGLTLGRLFLTRPAARFGHRRSVIVLSLLTTTVVGLVWAVPNLYAAAVLLAFAGAFIGPNYSLVIGQSVKPGMLPRKIQVVSITIISAFGSIGGALLPFLVGLLSQLVGTYVVLPMFIALYLTMALLWVCLPNVERVGGGKNLLEKFW